MRAHVTAAVVIGWLLAAGGAAAAEKETVRGEILLKGLGGADPVLREAEAALARGDHGAAVPLLQMVLERFPDALMRSTKLPNVFTSAAGRRQLGWAIL